MGALGAINGRFGASVPGCCGHAIDRSGQPPAPWRPADASSALAKNEDKVAHYRIQPVVMSR